ncbi:MAG: PLDc_N domain-containing protein [Clostridiales bacterium]|nr:PLDc_N domain-containing protein [Clostridiales bacterium]
MEEYMVLLIPIIIIQAILAVTALVHVLKHNNYRFGSKGLWIVVVLFINIIGPIVYFILGKGDE